MDYCTSFVQFSSLILIFVSLAPALPYNKSKNEFLMKNQGRAFLPLTFFHHQWCLQEVLSTFQIESMVDLCPITQSAACSSAPAPPLAHLSPLQISLFISLLICLFITFDLKSRITERGRQGKKSSISPGHFPDSYNNKAWTRLSARDRNSITGVHEADKGPRTWAVFHCLPSALPQQEAAW